MNRFYDIADITLDMDRIELLKKVELVLEEAPGFLDKAFKAFEKDDNKSSRLTLKAALEYSGDYAAGKDMVQRPSIGDEIGRDDVFVLENIRSSHNIGAILRVAECFGHREIILAGFSDGSASLSKTAMGSEQSLKIHHADEPKEAIRDFKAKGYRIIGLEIGEEPCVPIQTSRPQGPCAVILGNERHGISLRLLEMCDEVWAIPLSSSVKSSLNVSQAAAICGFWLSFNK